MDLANQQIIKQYTFIFRDSIELILIFQQQQPVSGYECLGSAKQNYPPCFLYQQTVPVVSKSTCITERSLHILSFGWRIPDSRAGPGKSSRGSGAREGRFETGEEGRGRGLAASNIQPAAESLRLCRDRISV
jgi:hypothetical protein